eukprot:TRINITY_DN5183_c0_g1_i1.p1 TRINITY_DN5183_c0_g1~~TRINITY_DN5183_c0_g1_i1.p1  ORF type:complete len:129 (-),score=15.44 TRINITY_DN5183_c0_g1_i1:28-414(-)
MNVARIELEQVEIKTQKMQQSVEHLDSIISNKEVLKTHILHPMAFDCLPIHRSYHQNFKEMMLNLRDLLHKFTTYTHAIQNVQSFSLQNISTENSRDQVLTKLFAQCELYSQSMIMCNQSLMRMKSSS